MRRALPPLLALALLVATGCVEATPCSERPDDPACQPWVCCSTPSAEGCDPAEVARRCADAGPLGDAGPDAAPHDAAPPDAGDAGPCGGTCADPTPLCDTMSNTCVACLGDGDCTDPAAPICAAGACRGCTADAECESMATTPTCDEPSGRCVECTPDTEATTCPAPGNLACHPTDLTCTGAERGRDTGHTTEVPRRAALEVLSEYRHRVLIGARSGSRLVQPGDAPPESRELHPHHESNAGRGRPGQRGGTLSLSNDSSGALVIRGSAAHPNPSDGFEPMGSSGIFLGSGPSTVRGATTE